MRMPDFPVFPLFRSLHSFYRRSSLSLLPLLMLAVCLLNACSTAPLTTKTAPVPTPAAPQPARLTVNSPLGLPANGQSLPELPREFRAVWVSTVANIDWPSRRDLSSDKQKAEIISLLDEAAQMRLNAIILQVRPAADAIYPSSLEPWSEFLTGEQGRAPSPFYDPLQFWIEQAHARGLELHAWFNPFRARTAVSRSQTARNHVSRSMPEVVRNYGDLQWMDPGEPQAAQQTLAVIQDVLRRYDVDGIHIDDYFYPYPIKNAQGGEQDFPDEASWTRYQQGGGQLSRADWRRQNVNQLVQAISQMVHQEKSWVKFGISPFGIGRPSKMPPGITGFSQYDRLYADVELWLANGWLDYLAPQLYWPINQTAQAFKVLQNYWISQNSMQRHIWPGLFTSRIDHSDKSWPAEEILNQVDAVREAANDGHVHFSMVSLHQNRKDIRQRLAAEKYTSVALVPASPWLESTNLAAPQLTPDLAASKLQVRLMDPENTRWLAVWRRSDQQWSFSFQPATQLSIVMQPDAAAAPLRQISVLAISRSGQASLPASYLLPSER